MVNHLVLITARAFRRAGEDVHRKLTEAGCELLWSTPGRPLSAKELIPLVAGADGVVAGNDAFTAEVFAAALKLKVISRWGVGVDAIDLQAATRHGVVVTNTPGVIVGSVADIVFGFYDCAGKKNALRRPSGALWKLARGGRRGHRGQMSGHRRFREEV